MTSGKSDILELARSRLIAARVGLISRDELQHWADGKIRELSEPPDFLFSVSMGSDNELNFLNRLDLVCDKPTEEDGAILAAEILECLEEGSLSLDQLESIGLSCENFLDIDSECWARFSWIADEIYLAREGVKDQITSHREILNVLRSMVA